MSRPGDKGWRAACYMTDSSGNKRVREFAITGDPRRLEAAVEKFLERVERSTPNGYLPREFHALADALHDYRFGR